VGEHKIMANHVYFTITVEGLEDEQFQENVKFETRVGTRYDGEEYKYEALLELEEQPFMSNVYKEFDEDGDLKNSYDWYCDNIGAKWCHIEECEYGYIAGYSAWRQPHELVLNILEFYANEYDIEVSASMTYEDEFRNFMGKQYYGTVHDDDGWRAWEGDYNETDGSALVEQFQELYPSIDTEDENFWYNEYEVDGEKIYPNEVIDELADQFWESC
jgi:hypothetical protein